MKTIVKIIIVTLSIMTSMFVSSCESKEEKAQREREQYIYDVYREILQYAGEHSDGYIGRASMGLYTGGARFKMNSPKDMHDAYITVSYDMGPLGSATETGDLRGWAIEKSTSGYIGDYVIICDWVNRTAGSGTVNVSIDYNGELDVLIAGGTWRYVKEYKPSSPDHIRDLLEKAYKHCRESAAENDAISEKEAVEFLTKTYNGDISFNLTPRLKTYLKKFEFEVLPTSNYGNNMHCVSVKKDGEGENVYVVTYVLFGNEWRQRLYLTKDDGELMIDNVADDNSHWEPYFDYSRSADSYVIPPEIITDDPNNIY